MNHQWLQQQEHGLRKLVIPPELRPDWHVFFQKYMLLRTVNATVADMLAKMEHNFFISSAPTVAHIHYFRFVTLLMWEGHMDVHGMDFDSFFSSLDTNPQKPLLFPDNHNYRLLKEAAAFLHCYDHEFTIDLNHLPYTTSSNRFQSMDYEDFLGDAKKAYMDYIRQVHHVSRQLEQSNEKIEMLVNTQSLVRPDIIQNFSLNSRNIALLKELIVQDVLKLALPVIHEEHRGESLFEFLMMRPLPSNVEILQLLLMHGLPDIHLDNALSYFTSLMDEHFCLKWSQFKREHDNYMSMLSLMERMSLKQKLEQNLLQAKGKSKGKL